MKNKIQKSLNLLLVFVMFFTYIVPVYALDKEKNTNTKNISLTDKVITLKDNSKNGDFKYQMKVEDSINLIYNTSFNSSEYFYNVLKEKINDNNINIQIKDITDSTVKYQLTGYNESYEGEFYYTKSLNIELSNTKEETITNYFKSILGDVPINLEKQDNKYKITIKDKSEFFNISKIEQISTINDFSDKISYQTHFSGVGWESYVKGGAEKEYPNHNLEAIKIKLNDNKVSGDIAYKAYVDSNWQEEVKNDETSGTTGQGKPIQAIQIKLTGKLAEEYDILYRVKITDYGWTGWAQNEAKAGSTDASIPLQGIQIKLVKKNSEIIEKENPSFLEATPKIKYETYSDSWQEEVENGATSGSTKQAKNVKSIKVNLVSQIYAGEISYQTKAYNGEWSNLVKGGIESGDINSIDGIEAIKINLTGKITDLYSIYYKTYITGHGWLDWAKNGEVAGTSGFDSKIEAIQIKIVPNTKPIDSKTTSYLTISNLISYSTHFSGVGWENYVTGGAEKGYPNHNLEAIKIKLNDDKIPGDIAYKAYVGSKWQSEVKNDETAGTTGQGKPIEALQIKLTGKLAETYDILYRVNIENYGWAGWTKNGGKAGSVDASLPIRKIQIKLIKKDSEQIDENIPSFLEAVPKIKYTTYNDSWQEEVEDGAISGNANDEKNIKSIKLNLISQMYKGEVSYQTKAYNGEWSNSVNGGVESGNINYMDGIEAIKINLSGNVSNYYDIYYKTYIKEYGWLDWAKNGEVAGTSGLDSKIEAIKIKIVDKKDKITTTNTSYLTINNSISYSTHFSGVGWENYVTGGAEKGYPNHNLEAIKIKLDDNSISGDISYKAYVGSNWQEGVKNDEISGTTGQGKPIEAIQIKLTGKLAEVYDILYRVNIKEYGWAGWTKNGNKAGSVDASLPIQGIQIKLIKKDSEQIDEKNPSFLEATPKIKYETYTDNWQKEVENGATSGYTNDEKNIKSIKINLISQMYKGDLSYQVKSYNGEWLSEVTNNNETGEISNANGIEAIKIRLTGDVSTRYNIYYRVYLEEYGWLDWAKNGEVAGTSGLDYKVGAIQIKLVNKSEKVTPTSTAYLTDNNSISYSTHVSGIGWQDYVSGGEEAGTLQHNIEALKIKLNDNDISGDIVYKAYVGSSWQSEVKNNEISGTTGQGKPVQAIQIKLTGNISKIYDIYYRVYISGIDNYTWLGWTKDNNIAGSAGSDKPIQKIQLKLVRKGKDPNLDTTTPSSLNATPKIKYKTYSDNWQEEVENGAVSGTLKENVKAFDIKVESELYNGSINYQLKPTDQEWESVTSSPTVNQNAYEAIRINLTGNIANIYDIYYKVYIKDRGWAGWAKNGELAGSEKISSPIQGIQIKLVPKGTTIDKGGHSFINPNVTVVYQAHVSTIGWQSEVTNGETSGTTGQGKPIEAVKIRLTDTSLDGGISYKINVGHRGWQEEVTNGMEAGTTGQSLKTEGIMIKLTGELANYYDIYYRLHVSGFGWLDWAKNGAKAGTSGSGRAIEALEIKLVEKDGPAPGPTANYYKEGTWGSKVFAGVLFDTYTSPLGEVANDFKYIDGTKYLFNSQGCLIARNAKRIIDVSSHQGHIDWGAVKYAGHSDEKLEVDGVIVRIGAWLQKGFDPELAYNVSELNRVGLPYGAYLYSYAVDGYEDVPALGLEYAHCGYLDARAIDKAINDYGMNLTYPIYYDLEANGTNTGWTFNQYRPIIEKFNEQMIGYANLYGGEKGNMYRNWQIYANLSWINSALVDSMVWDRITWVAHYQTDFLGYSKKNKNWNLNYTYSMWQYTEGDYIPGISTNVDSSVYGDFTYHPSQFR